MSLWRCRGLRHKEVSLEVHGKITEDEFTVTSLAGPSLCSLTHVGLLWAPVVTKGAGDQGPPSPAGADLEPSPGDAAKPTPFAFAGRKLSNPWPPPALPG